MPLIRITLSEAYGEERRRAIAAGVFEAMVEAIGCPPDNRFQLISVVPDGDVVFDPSFMSPGGREDVVCIEITLVAGRSAEQKADLYRLACERLSRDAGVRPEDVFVVLTENHREDWSVGEGEPI